MIGYSGIYLVYTVFDLVPYISGRIGTVCIMYVCLKMDKIFGAYT